MNIKKTIIVLFLFLSILYACTSFVLEQNGLHYLSKNLDWEIDRGYLYYNLDGIRKVSISDPALMWTSKYKSITNNQFGKEFPLGGMNEAGLVIEEMSLFGQSYTLDEGKKQLNEFQWIQYQLDMSASVEDVIASLKSITIKHEIMNLHYLIVDRSGDRAVVECLEKGVMVYRAEDLPYPVLSNNPYKKALRYLSFFEGYGGDMKVEHRNGSQERYVSAVWLLDQYVNESPVEYIFKILDTVKQEDTRWQFIYDPFELRVTCKTHCNTERFTIGFKDLENTRHNRYSVTLFGGEYKMVKMKAQKNREHLEYIHEKLKAYFPGKEQIYELMMEEGKKSLRQK